MHIAASIITLLGIAVLGGPLDVAAIGAWLPSEVSSLYYIIHLMSISTDCSQKRMHGYNIRNLHPSMCITGTCEGSTAEVMKSFIHVH